MLTLYSGTKALAIPLRVDLIERWVCSGLIRQEADKPVRTINPSDGNT